MVTTIQAARFFAAALIVVQHTDLLMALPRYYNYRSAFSNLNTAIGVDFFFVLSGFVIFFAHRKDIDRPSRLARYLVNRARRIYPPYAVVFLFVLVPLYFTQSSYQDLVRSPKYLLSSLLLLPTEHVFVQVSWTLQHEVAFYLIFATLILSRTLGVVLMGLWFIGAALTPDGLDPTSNVFLNFRHLEFLFGIIAAAVIQQNVVPAPQAVLAVGIVGLLIALIDPQFPFGATGATSAENMIVAVALSSAMVLCSLVELERSRGWKAPQALRYLGDASYAIYLVHFSVVTIVGRVFTSLHAERFLPLPLLFTLLVIAGILSGALFHSVAEAPVQRWLKRRFALKSHEITESQGQFTRPEAK